MDVKYRQIHENELEDLLALYRQLALPGEVIPTGEQAAAAWHRIMDGEWPKILVAEADGKPVSTCMITVIPGLTNECRPFAFMEYMVTDEKYRGKGIGTQLLKYGIRLAWDNNCYKVMGMTGRQTEPIFHFYETAGFKRGTKTAFIIRKEDVE
jgi:GNAT superfamily N-acetyltransferase